MIAACQSDQHKPDVNQQTAGLIQPDLICPDAERFAGRQVGDGHCVSLIKLCSGSPDTVEWSPGEYVLGNTLPYGSIIATFKNGRYPNKTGWHAAIYIKQSPKGIWVWDQWKGKAVHQRLIKIRNDGANDNNTAQAYRVVRLNDGE